MDKLDMALDDIIMSNTDSDPRRGGAVVSFNGKAGSSSNGGAGGNQGRQNRKKNKNNQNSNRSTGVAGGNQNQQRGGLVSDESPLGRIHARIRNQNQPSGNRPQQQHLQQQQQQNHQDSGRPFTNPIQGSRGNSRHANNQGQTRNSTPRGNKQRGRKQHGSIPQDIGGDGPLARIRARIQRDGNQGQRQQFDLPPHPLHHARPTAPLQKQKLQNIKISVVNEQAIVAQRASAKPLPRYELDYGQPSASASASPMMLSATPLQENFAFHQQQTAPQQFSPIVNNGYPQQAQQAAFGFHQQQQQPFVQPAAFVQRALSQQQHQQPLLPASGRMYADRADTFYSQPPAPMQQQQAAPYYTDRNPFGGSGHGIRKI